MKKLHKNYQVPSRKPLCGRRFVADLNKTTEGVYKCLLTTYNRGL